MFSLSKISLISVSMSSTSCEQPQLEQITIRALWIWKKQQQTNKWRSHSNSTQQNEKKSRIQSHNTIFISQNCCFFEANKQTQTNIRKSTLNPTRIAYTICIKCLWCECMCGVWTVSWRKEYNDKLNLYCYS